MNDKGNALFLILIAVVLFAAISYAVTKTGNSGSDGIISTKAELAAANILNYQTSIKVGIDRMVIRGIEPSDIDFTKPSEAGFNTPPFRNKVYHPDGGGVSYQDLPATATASYDYIDGTQYAFLDYLKYLNPISTAHALDLGDFEVSPMPDIIVDPDLPVALDAKGNQLGRFNNFEWTPSSEDDIVSSSLGVSKAVCMALNKSLTGSTEIPILPNSLQYYVAELIGGDINSDLTSSSCPECNQKAALCTAETTTGQYNFYNIVLPL